MISNSKEGPTVVPMVPAYGATETVQIDEAPLLSLSEAVIENNNNGDNGIIEMVGEAPRYQDVFFAFLFGLHLLLMLWLGTSVAPEGYSRMDLNWTKIEDEIRASDDVTEEDFEKFQAFLDAAGGFIQVYPERILGFLLLPSLLIAFIVAMLLTMLVIRPFSTEVVYASLVGSVIGTCLFMFSFLFNAASVPVFLLTGAALASVGYYVRIAWRMVPFAAVNLKVALEGIGSNWGMYIVAFVFAELGFAWNIYWFYTLVGVSALKNGECMSAHPEATFDDDTCGPPPLVFLGFLLSLYWTSTVVMVSLL